MADPIKLQKLLHWIGEQRGAGLNEDQINALLAKAGRAHTVADYHAMADAAQTNPATSGLQELGRGVLAMVPASDKLLGSVAAAGDLSQPPGAAYHAVQTAAARERAGFAQEHPKAAVALPVLAGALGGGMGLPEAPSMLAKMGMGAGVGAGLSAVESPDLASVPRRALFGAAAGGALAPIADAVLGSVARRFDPTRMGRVAAAGDVAAMARNTGTTSAGATGELARLETVRPGLSIPADAQPQWASDLRANVNKGVGNTQPTVNAIRLRGAGTRDRALNDLQELGGAHPQGALPAKNPDNPRAPVVQSPFSVPQQIAQHIREAGDRLYDPLRAATPNGIPITDRLRTFLSDPNVTAAWEDVRPLGGKTDAVKALMDRGVAQPAAEAAVAARGTGNPSFDQLRQLEANLNARGDEASGVRRSDIANTMYDRARQLRSIMEQTPQLKGYAAANHEYGAVNSLDDTWKRGYQHVDAHTSPVQTANDIAQAKVAATPKYADLAVDAYRRGAMQHIFETLAQAKEGSTSDISGNMLQVAHDLFPSDDAFENFVARATADGTFADQARGLLSNSSTAAQTGAMMRTPGGLTSSLAATTHGGAYLRISEGLRKLVGNPALARATAIRFRELMSTPGGANREDFLRAIDGLSGEPNLGGAGAAGAFAATTPGQGVGSAEFTLAGHAISGLLRHLGVQSDATPAAPTTVPQ